MNDNSSLITHPFSIFTLNLASLTLNLAPQTLNFGLCTSNNSITLYSETEVSGTITENTTWQRDRHFIVAEDITVPQNTSLTIEPGAIVRFDSYYKLKIEGNLLCQGEPDNIVMFSSNQDQPMSGDWSRLELEGVDSTSTIECTRISFAANGIMCNRVSPRISRTFVGQSTEEGILIASESAPIIEHNLVFNASTGIGVEGSSEPKLSYNIIANEGKETLSGTGVVINASSAKIEDNIILHYGLIVSNKY